MKILITYYWRSLRSRVPFFKLVSGISFAVVFPITFYFFSCVLMEAFRLLTVTPEYDIWMPSAKERNFYQLFFAFVSTILAQSFCLVYWFDRPRRAFERRHRSAVMIINGQRNLNWFFLSWISKVVFVWLIVFIISPGFFYAFSLYPSYNCLPILLIVVLFLQPWVAMRLAFKRKTLKWLALSAFLVAFSSFGLSRINIVDYESHDNMVLSRNIYHTYDLELPATDAFEKTDYLFSKEVYLVRPNVSRKSDYYVIMDGEIVDLQSFSTKIEEWRSTFWPCDAPMLSCRFVVDKSLKMRDVNQVRKLLADLKLYRVQYAVVPKYQEFDIRYYTFWSFPMRIYKYWDSSSYQKVLEDVQLIPNQIYVFRTTSGTYSINDAMVEDEELMPMLKDLIEKNLDYIIRLRVDDDMQFGEYMNVVTSAKECLNELMQEYALQMYSKPLDQLDNSEETEILSHFPFRLFEENNALLR